MQKMKREKKCFLFAIASPTPLPSQNRNVRDDTQAYILTTRYTHMVTVFKIILFLRFLPNAIKLSQNLEP